MTGKWKELRYHLECAGLVVGTKVVRVLPRIAVVCLARVFGSIAWIVDRRGRRVAFANLECAFGEKYSRRQKRRITRESYRHFAQTMLDLLWSPRLTKANFRRYIDVAALEDVRRTYGDQPNLIIACFHYSNFEWFSLACGYGGYPAIIVAQEFKNKLLDPVFRGLREQSGHEFIPRTGAILRLYKALRRKGTTALLVDLTIQPGPAAVAINCFGLETSVTSAHAWLHQRSGAPLIPAFCQPLGRGRYKVVLHPPVPISQSATLRQVAQACWNSFEPVVKANPAPWLWVYKHWRYRPKNARRAYPFYASEHRRFERMLAQQ